MRYGCVTGGGEAFKDALRNLKWARIATWLLPVTHLHFAITAFKLFFRSNRRDLAAGWISLFSDALHELEGSKQDPGIGATDPRMNCEE